MRLSTFLLPGTAVLLLTACEATRTAREATNVPSVAGLTQGLTHQVSQGPYQFDIQGIKGPNSNLVVRTRRNGKRIAAPLRIAVAGEPTQAVATDLDNDGNPELLVFSNSSGPNEGFYGYELEPSGFVPLAGPGPVAGPAAYGYTGPDAYTVSAQTLVRSFALSTGDAAARTITYRLLPTNKWKVRQVMEGPR